MIAFATTLRSTCLSPVAVPFFPSPPTGPWEKLPVVWGLSARPESGVVFSMLPQVSSEFCFRVSAKGRAKPHNKGRANPYTRVAQRPKQFDKKNYTRVAQTFTRGSRKVFTKGSRKPLHEGRANSAANLGGGCCLLAGRWYIDWLTQRLLTNW